jgi:hypothetical protein
MHETTDGDRGRCGTPQVAGNFAEGTLDVIDGKRGSAFRIPMEIPRRIVNGQHFHLLIESRPADSA